MRSTTLVAIFFSLISNFAHATLFTVSDQQEITTNGSIADGGQKFDFEFLNVPTTGSNGQFSITLNGDYSGNDTESAVVRIDSVEGMLDLGADVNGIITNTISGLTLSTYSVAPDNGNDRELSWTFNIDDALLNTIISDGMITANVLNDWAVDPYNASDPDFVKIGFSYDVTDSFSIAVPEPSSLSLLILGVFGLGAWRRCQPKIKTYS